MKEYISIQVIVLLILLLVSLFKTVQASDDGSFVFHGQHKLEKKTDIQLFKDNFPPSNNISQQIRFSEQVTPNPPPPPNPTSPPPFEPKPDSSPPNTPPAIPPKTPNENPPSNSPSNPPVQPAASSSIEGGSFLKTLFIICLLAGVGALIFFAYSKYMEYIIQTEGAMKTELGIRRQDLNQKQIMLLNLLSFNSKTEDFTKKFHCPDVLVNSTTEKVNQVTLGDYLNIEFTKAGPLKMIVCNYPLNPKLENSYFEIEVDQVKQVPEDPIIGIGFISATLIEDYQGMDENFTEDNLYQKILDSLDAIMFASNGFIQHGNRQINLNFQALSYGETLGIGFSKSTQRVWITLNGEFLNPPTEEEIQRQADEKNKAKIDAKKEIESTKTKEEIKEKELLQALLKERVFKMAIMKGKDEYDQIYPFIISNCECVLDVNVGGYPFRFTQREIATGLLD